METMRERDFSFLLSDSGSRSYDTVTIPSGTGKVKPGTALGKITATKAHIPSPNATVVGKEGAETACAVNCYHIDATDADVEALVLNIDAEVKRDLLVYDASVNDAAKIAAKNDQLTTKSGIKVR